MSTVTTPTNGAKSCCSKAAVVEQPSAQPMSATPAHEHDTSGSAGEHACCASKNGSNVHASASSTAVATAGGKFPGVHVGSLPLSVSHSSTHSESPEAASSEAKQGLSRYLPLFTIVGIILLATLAVALRDAQLGQFSFERWMSSFMAGFFLTFAGFKLINLPGFVQGYSTYDLLAKRVPAYGYVYPFIELALGLAYLTGFQHGLANWATLVVMTFSSLGVLQVLRQRRKVMCACLGTAIRLPLTTVTLVEDLGMAAMALAMLLA
jgi:hypothetical protein